MKKFFGFLGSILVWLLVAATICMMVFTFVSVNTFDRTDRDIFGYKFFVVLSDSMKASNINAGDIVIIKEDTNLENYQAGDIIAYTSRNTDNYGETVTHMIRTRTKVDGETAYITYGTTTGKNDPSPVMYYFVLGKCVGKLAYLGTFFQFLKTTPGYVVCILVPFLALILFYGIKSIGLFRKYKQEQQAEMNAQRQKLEEERRQSQEMMKELQALKDQLAAQQKQPGGTPPEE